MDIPWRIVIHQTRYGGVYEHHALWFAVFCGDEFPEDSIGEDVPCAVFWTSPESELCGLGATPDEALRSLFENNGLAQETYERIYGIEKVNNLRGNQSCLSKLKRFAARFSIKEYQLRMAYRKK